MTEQTEPARRCLADTTAALAVERATRMAEPLVAAAGTTMPAPRYTRTACGTRTTKRVSCCLLYRAPGRHNYRGCPGIPPGDRP